MAYVKDPNTLFMILVSNFSLEKIHISYFLISHSSMIHLFRNRPPEAIYHEKRYVDRWDENHVHMPCSPKFVDVSRNPSYLFLKISLDDIEEQKNLCGRK